MRSSFILAFRFSAACVLGSVLLVACGDSASDDDATGGAAGSGAGQAGTSSNAGASGSNASAGTSSGASGTNSGASGASGTGGDSDGSGGKGGASSGAGGSSAGTSAGSGTAGDGTGGSAGSNAGSGGSAGTSGGDAGQSGAGGLTGAVPSEGCSATDFPASGTYMLDVDGTEREYIVKVPADYAPGRPYRLIFAFHGRMYDAESVDTGGPPGSGPYYGIEAEADGNAIFVAAQALETSWTNQDGRDVAYVDAMLARFEGQYCIDKSRVFSVGFSMGSIMTITLGCSHPDVFRAIAVQSGSMPSGSMLPEPCSEPLAYWGSHGLQDTTIRPEQGEAVAEAFAGYNGCDPEPMPVEPEGCVAYQNCDPGRPASFCTFEGEHEPAPYAGVEIWKFFSQF